MADAKRSGAQFRAHAATLLLQTVCLRTVPWDLALEHGHFRVRVSVSRGNGVGVPRGSRRSGAPEGQHSR